MASEARASILVSILGIIICGGIGGITAWAVVTAVGWDGTLGAILAAIIGMVVATAAWAGASTLLRALGRTR
jgi:hypothetical protein